MKSKSTSSTTKNKTSPRVSFTTDRVQNTPRQSPSTSNNSPPLPGSPLVFSFDKVVGKVFKKNILAALTSKDEVLNEIRDCIIRSDEQKLKQLSAYLHNYWRDLHVSSGCVCLRCFDHPFCIFVNYFVWLRKLASVDFSRIRGPRLLIYSVILVFRSSRFPNFAILLLRTVTSNFSALGSLK